MFSTPFSPWANFVCSEVLDVVLVRLDGGFLFPGLKTVLESEPGAVNLNAQENLPLQSERDPTLWEPTMGNWRAFALSPVELPPVVAVWACGLRVVVVCLLYSAR